MLEIHEDIASQPLQPKKPFFEQRLWVVARRISRFTGRTLGICVLLFLALAFLIQLPSVQRWGIAKTTVFLSKELNTKVAISDFRLDFFDILSIGDVYIGNQNAPSDTLLYVGRLSIDVNYLDLIWGIIQLDAIRLEQAKVRLRREIGQHDDNLQFIIDYFDPPQNVKNPTPSKTADIRFGEIHLRNIDFTNDDRVRGELIHVKFKAADIHTNIINLPNKIMDLRRVNVYKPYVYIAETMANPLPNLTLAQVSYQDEHPQVSNKLTETKPFQFLIGAVSVENGIFKLDNWDKNIDEIAEVLPDSTIDFDHLLVDSINISIHNFMFTKDEWTGVVDRVSLKEKSGFILQKLTVGDAKVSPTETSLYGLLIETPFSTIGDTFRMFYPSGYTAFLDYNNQVTMDGRIHTSKVHINDILYFTPPLKENPFFKKNRYANAYLTTKAFGKVNSLKLRPFNISLAEKIFAEGVFESRNLDDVNETRIHLDLKELRTNMSNLTQLIPGFKAGSPLDKLGGLNFRGKFNGFFHDFTADGLLETSIGAAVMDMKLKPASNTTEAFYNGSLALKKFNLGALTGDSDLGRITMKTEILRGSGFSKDKMVLDLVAIVDNFQYRNYDYQKLNLSGMFSHKQFTGEFESKDPNVDFKFIGSVDFNSNIPNYNFKSDIRQLNFQKLNLLNEDYALKGQFDLKLSGDKPSNISGTVNAYKLLITKDKTENYAIDSLFVSSLPNLVNGLNDGRKTFHLQSEILNVDIEGLFSLEQIPDALKRQFAKYHPLIAQDLGINTRFVSHNPTVAPVNQEFKFDIFIKNSKNFTKLIDAKLDTLHNIRMEGSFDDIQEKYNCQIATPETHRYEGLKIVEFEGKIGSEKDSLDWNFYITALKIGDDKDLDFRGLTFKNALKGDTVTLGLKSDDFSTALGLAKVDLNVILMRQDSIYKLSFGTKQLSKLDIFGDSWEIDRDNFMLIDKDRFSISGFNMRNDDRRIVLMSEGKRGLNVLLDNFDIAFLNKHLDDDRFTFKGKYKIRAGIENILKMENFGATAWIDSLVVSGENRGAFSVNIEGKDLKQPINAHIALTNITNKDLPKTTKRDTSKTFAATKDTAQIIARGFYYPSVWEGHLANSIDFDLSLVNYPFKTLQLLIPEGASGYKGRVEGEVKVDGPLNRINTNGYLRLHDAEITIDYLQIPLSVRNETVKITNTAFDATGAKIYDKFGNMATITGSLTHNRFQDFGLDIQASSDNFLFLNTTAKDNPLFYGVAIGKGDIRFSGDFDRTNILIKAKAGKGRDENRRELITRITFPFQSSEVASDKRLIVFKSKNQKTDKVDSTEIKPKIRDLKGVNLDMEVELTPDAEANLIFDEVAGDNIKARGTGNFRLGIDRTGDIAMNGEYRIERGDYLFTLFRLVNKNFAIKRGGTIRWNGTPFDATLNIDAEYKDLTTSPYNFVSEYVNSRDGTETESRKPTKVGLSLKLTGDMLKPDINFNMTFPQLQGTLKSFTESKLRILQQDPNELNKQAFGLIVVGSFLPSDIGVSQIRSGGINTLTETASNVVSNMLNNLVKEYITGLDIQVGYNYYQYDLVNASNPLAIGSGQQFRLRGSYALNDRLAISGGVGVDQGSYVQALSANNSNVFVGSDFYLDYDFSADRRLKLRVSYVRDQDIQGRRDKPAVGVRFQEEFNSIGELLESLRIKKITK